MSGFQGLGRAEVTLPSEMLSVEAYKFALLDRIQPPGTLEMAVTESLGLVLADDVKADEPFPAFANSGMDGYALHAGDVAEATVDRPVRLRVIGEVAAGASNLPQVGEGEAARIMTGAPVPPGADAIVAVEQTSGGGSDVLVHVAVEPGRHIRTVGQDVAPGDTLLREGRRIGPGDIGLLAALGHATVRCIPQPRVVVIPTGDELIDASERPQSGQIRDSNGPMLAAKVREAGAIAYRHVPVIDSPSALTEAIESSLTQADLILTSGGVSAGAHDHLVAVLGRLGEVVERKVAMKPGMPQAYGIVHGVPVIALPGNPASSFVSFEIFVRPVIRKMQGRRDLDRPIVTAVLEQAVKSSPHRRSFIRVRLRREDRRWIATAAGHQGSHALKAVSRADGLAEIPEDVTEVEAGSEVTVRLLVDP